MRLTIVIPTLNRDYCIGRAIDSALAQTSPHVEIIVSNNGSTDKTREIIDRYADPRLRVFHHTATMSIAEHSNLLINEAHGELIVALSDDDWLEPTFADRMLNLFARHPEMSFGYARCSVHVGDHELPSPPAPEIEETLPFFQNYFDGQRHLFWCACVTRTAELRKLFPIPANVQLGDMYLWTQLAFDGPVGCVPEVLAHYTYLVDNASLGIPVSVWAEETRQLMARIERRYRGAQEEPVALDRLIKVMRRYLARTTANQFALNASKGETKASLLRALRSCGRLLLPDLTTSVPRVAASLALPAPLMRRLVTNFAATRSRWASTESATPTPIGQPGTVQAA